MASPRRVWLRPRASDSRRDHERDAGMFLGNKHFSGIG